MAADGYGRGRIEGRRKRRSVILRTTEKVWSFRLNNKPTVLELVEETRHQAELITIERIMEHKNR
jgi:hypothetical protein